MKLVYIKEATFVSDGIAFAYNEEYDLSTEVATKLLATFPSFFKVIVTKEDEPKAKPEVKELSVTEDEPKAKPRAKK
jgi:hypothetical protein